jgi:hypothetical protein
MALVLVAALEVAAPNVAEAGAPNYECEAGPWRFAIDQHRRAGLIRLADQTVVEADLQEGDQNGSSLGVTLSVDSLSLASQITGTGKSLNLTVSDGKSTTGYSGACAFVPGNFILGHVSGARLAVRTRKSSTAPVLARVSRHGLVWVAAPENSPSDPAPTTQQGWARVRVVYSIRSGSQQIGIGNDVGLEGPSTVMQGWGRIGLITLVTATT